MRKFVGNPVETPLPDNPGQKSLSVEIRSFSTVLFRQIAKVLPRHPVWWRFERFVEREEFQNEKLVTLQALEYFYRCDLHISNAHVLIRVNPYFIRIANRQYQIRQMFVMVEERAHGIGNFYVGPDIFRIPHQDFPNRFLCLVNRCRQSVDGFLGRKNPADGHRSPSDVRDGDRA